MTNKIIQLSIIAFSLLVASPAYTDICQDWFNQLHLENDKDCLIKCGAAPAGMSTFMCNTQCDTFCKPRPHHKCPPNKEWEDKLKDGHPIDWPNEKELASPWSQEERQKMLDIFVRLSNSFSANGLVGIYKLERPRSFSSLGAYSSYFDGHIIFYQKAFNGDKEPIRLFVHEFGHHLHETALKNEFADYNKVLNWPDSGETRPGNFVRPDGKDSPEEDFAINFETYILEPQNLKSIVPKAYRWMTINLKNKFNLKECKK